MKEINELDSAQLRHEMRELYKSVGYDCCIQALYEIIKAGEILSEVMLEERKKEFDEHI